MTNQTENQTRLCKNIQYEIIDNDLEIEVTIKDINNSKDIKSFTYNPDKLLELFMSE